MTTLSRWARHLAVERGFAPRSIALYISEVGKLPGIQNPGGITPAQIRRHLEAAAGRGCGPRTIARLTATFRAFWRWAVPAGLADSDPTAGLSSPRLPRRLPRHLGAGRLRDVLDAPSGANVIRDRALLAVLAYTGLRISEVLSLSVGDVAGNGHVRVVGKGNKERSVPMHPNLSVRLAPHLEGKAAGDALFPMSIWAAERTVRRWAGVSPHVLRSTFATALHEAGVDIVEISRLLGHANLSTTMVYVATDEKKLSESVARLP